LRIRRHRTLGLELRHAGPLPAPVGAGTWNTPVGALSHASLREFRQVGANAVLFALALFVAIGRF